MQKRNLISLCLLTFLLPSLSFALTKKDVLKAEPITGTKYYCLYYADSTKVGTVNKKGKYKAANFSKVKKEVTQERDNYKKKVQQERNASRKKQYKKQLKKLEKAALVVDKCKNFEPAKLACEIHEPKGISTTNQKSGNVNQKIINGQTCNARDSRVAKLTMYYTNGAVGRCTGTLVTKNKILTAAHCITDLDDGSYINKLKVTLAGRDYYARTGWHNNLHDIMQYYIPHYADTAVLELREDVPIKPMPLVSKRATASSGTIAAIIGYGIYSYSLYYSFSDFKAGFATISEVTETGINSKFKNVYTQSNSCNGDSGGPLTIYEDGEWRLFGVASWGDDDFCGYFYGTDSSWWSRVNSPYNIDFIERYAGKIFN